MLAVLFSMLLQSVHSFEHLSKLFSEEKCHHKYTGKDEITHQHHPFDHCFVCEFTFSSFLEAQTLSFQSHSISREIPYFFTSTQTTERFSGSAYSLRGPPKFIV